MSFGTYDNVYSFLGNKRSIFVHMRVEYFFYRCCVQICENTLCLSLIIEVFPSTRKMERKEKPLALKSFWAWCNITWERGCSPISSLAILVRRAPFWPVDMHTVCAREWREGLKPVTQLVWPVWLVQTPGRLIAHTQQDFSFLFIFREPGKTSVIRVIVSSIPVKRHLISIVTKVSIYISRSGRP